MSYESTVVLAAVRKLEQRRNESRTELEAHRREALERLPGLQDLEDEMARTAVSVTRAILSNRDEALMEGLRLKGEQILEEKKKLLRSAGYPGDYLTEKHVCEKCKDTGSVQGRTCSCMKNLLKEEAAASLDRVSGVGRTDFSRFSLDWYSDTETIRSGLTCRAHMASILRYAMQYPEGFGNGSESLFFSGGTGLGKTYLSLAIAYAVSDRGNGVIYGPAADLLGAVEQEHFGRGESRTELDRLLNIDFLVIDDLGTEFTTSFTTATLFNLLNTRLLHNRPTLISTNLTPAQIGERYSERFSSRILGCYRIFGFVGQDIRQQKRLRSRNGPVSE